MLFFGSVHGNPCPVTATRASCKGKSLVVESNFGVLKLLQQRNVCKLQRSAASCVKKMFSDSLVSTDNIHDSGT